MKPTTTVLFWLFFFAGVFFYTSDFPLGICVCELSIALIIIFSKIGKSIKENDLLLFYSLFSIFYMIGNFMIVFTMDTPEGIKYDYYLIKSGVKDAAFISFLGYCSLVIGYSLNINIYGKYKLSGLVTDSFLDTAFILLCLYHIQWFFTGIEIKLANFATYPILLLYIKSCIIDNKKIRFNWAIALTFLVATKGILYSYRRQEAFEPFVIFFVAIYTAYQGEWRRFVNFKYLAVLVCLIFIATQFDTLGKIRAASGQERVEEWLKYYNDDNLKNIDIFDDKEEEEEAKNIIARSSNLNQLSQVVSLVEDKGYYNGSSMTYIGYAFIPRMIWPEKPLIMQGRWFAMEAGLAYNHGVTNSLADVNNSINMTVAGELYLNFGYLGVLFGMIFIGVLLNSSWQMTDFYDIKNNLTGTILGLFLIAVSYFYIQVDLQFIVNYVQAVLIVVALNVFLNNKFPVHTS